MRERQIEIKLRDAVKIKGGLALKFVSPGMVGVPDRIVLAPDGRVYFVELKAPGKSLSLKQLKIAATLKRLGYKVRIIDSPEKVKEFVDEICSPRISNVCGKSSLGQAHLRMLFGPGNGKNSVNPDRH